MAMKNRQIDDKLFFFDNLSDKHIYIYIYVYICTYIWRFPEMRVH